MDAIATRTWIEGTVSEMTGLGLALGRGLEAGRRETCAQLASAGLAVLLVCSATQEATAQTGGVTALALVDEVARDPIAAELLAPPSARAVAPDSPVPSSQPAPSPAPSEADFAPSMIDRVRELDALLAVRGGRARLSARQTDASLAEAVARGSAPELEKHSGFKRRSNDLFRTQRELQVGDQELLLRLRLRAKKRDTMSVEVRF